ncbi:MAG: choice-of-anchor J domain-containing protein, partial [Candidatus Cloacimonetes bacterium]|nr:choice-of-anchor J domain-containing protein [Candidatus Cloacimonadota bacterium]
IYYDTGLNEDSIGLTAGGEFSAAIRFPASALTDYAGMSLYAISLWPGDLATYSLRVWTGGTPTAAGTQVVDQPFTVPTADVFQTVLLDNPVVVSGTEELWFGYNVTHTAGMYPAGCDGGPALNGFGNMIYNAGAWSTLYDLAPTLNYNWNIRGYVGFSAPTRAPELTPLAVKSGAFGEANGTDRVLNGYRVWRLLAANQDDEDLWVQLTPTNITPTNYTDNAWAPLPSGVYKYAIKAVYTNNVMSAPAFSNEIHKGMMGTLTGTVTEFGTNVPIAGATITAGDYSGTSDATGNYSFGVYQGTYTVTCVKTGYQSATQTGVNIVGLQTTTQNFVLTEITLPPGGVQAVEASPSMVNVTWMEPGGGTDITEGFEGTTFPPTDWTQVINNTGPAGTTGVYPTWCQVGTVALTPAVPPHSGEYQAALWWDYAHQDEWLITPQFICPPGADLNFWSYVYLGSTNLDHYYVKVSTDNGSSWTTLWDATALTGGWNYYDTPIAVDLDSYTGQEIKLAWQAIDGDSQGLWYVWFIDDVVVGNPTTTLRFPASSLTRVSAAGNDQRAPHTVIPKLPISREMMYTSGLTSANKVANETSVRDDRVLNGYQVWRLLQGQESNESAWVQLTPDAITATAWQDSGWGSVPDGTYKWAVKAIYTGGATSTPAFSNALPKVTEIGTIAGIVRNQQNAPIMGATVACGDVTATTNASGAYSMQVVAGTHDVTASAAGYAASTQTGVIVVTGQTTTVNFQLAPSQELLVDGFESYDNFALTFAPWTLVDVDMSTTYGMTGITWPNAYAAMAYMIFVPSATTPAVTDAEPHGGLKMAACFASTTPPNNDWLITPVLNNPTEIKFWAKSYTDDYGLERFKVGVGTDTNPNNFTIISGANYIQAPTEWTEYTYPLTGYPGNVYVGIQCLSNDAFIFFVDDVLVNGGGSANDDPGVPVVATELHGNFPNPFNPQTTIRYSVKEATPVTIEIYNVKGQVVKTLVSEAKASGHYTATWNGRDNNNQPVSSGVYFYKMRAGKYSNTKKMILMK